MRFIISIALIVMLSVCSIPTAAASLLAGEFATRARIILDSASFGVTGWLRTRERRAGIARTPQQTIQPGVRPRPPETKAQRIARATSLRLNPKGDVQLRSRQPMLFSAIPVDLQGSTIHGLSVEWASSDKQIISIGKTGQAIAGKPGQATLTATVGGLTGSVRVTVIEGTDEEFGGKKKVNSTRGGRRSGQNSDERIKPGNRDAYADTSRHHSSNGVRKFDSRLGKAGAKKSVIRSLPLPERPFDEDPLPDDETTSLYQPANLVGSPPGKTKPGATTASVATQGTENGNQNFSFGLPVVGLSGRGLGVSLSLVYNSQLWNKSTDPGDSSTWMTYDVDSGWPAQGFRLGFGQIEDQGSNGFTLTDPNGTRHALVHGTGYNYDTTDGTFIHYYGAAGWGTLSYPDGTSVEYGAGGGGLRIYPTKITDSNGNYIEISYAGTNGIGPKISSIKDTLERYVYFHYATNGDLVTITAPGLSGDLQTMRFYYTDVSIGTGLWDTGINYVAPSSVHALEYVYLPTSSDGSDAHVGYKFEYSPYGMIRQITQSRGMTVSSTSTSSTGSVTGEGTLSAQTTYNYPTSGASLTDVPKYSERADDWAGRTTGGSAPVYTFASSTGSGEKLSTVTAPDGTITETHTIDNSGNWNDGLVSDSYVQYGSTPTILAHSHLDWEQDSNSLNPRVSQVRTTDVPASLTKATVFSYSSYNNVSVVSERDFTTDGTVSSTELRKTETSYVTASNYTNRYLLRLPETVKMVQGGSANVLARIGYAYDNYGSSHSNLTSRNDIIMHDPAFDPFGGSYVSSTDYRGNVTGVTTYTDAATPSGSITHATTYDIAGNVMTAQVDCCQLKSFAYDDVGGNHAYAYLTDVTRGNPSGVNLTSSATYDYDTGLTDTTTDENGQAMEYSYYADSLRLNSVSYPGGGLTSLTYSDTLSADDSGKYHSYVTALTKLDGSGGSTRYVTSRRYFDGRGAVARTMSSLTAANGWSTQDIEYDTMGRAFRASNPYYATNDSATINSAGFWTTRTFDHLGRVTQVTMPRGDNDNSLTTSVQTSYDGIYTTVTDQASKTRRQKVDAMGRVIRLDEPTTSGLGSTSSPNQATNYEYDLLDNLVHIDQDSQDRYFKYDSLSRLIRERQVEQDTNSTYDVSDAWNTSGAWSRKIEYNSAGLVTVASDARGVTTTFSYDDLHRVTAIDYSDSTPDAHYYYDDAEGLPSGAPSSSSPDSFSTTHSNGRLVAMTYGSGATGNYFDYDVMGRVTKQFQITGSTPAKYKLSYTYNYAGLLTGETYPSTRALAYTYDEGARLVSVGDQTTTFANTFAYEAHGGLASETFGNTAVRALSYNRRLQASQVKLSLGSSVLQQYDYGYGAFNTSTGDVDTSKNNGQIGKVLGTIGTTAQWNQGFSYDELGRLGNVTEHQSSSMGTQTYSQSYTYDVYGNRAQGANSTLGLQAIAGSEINTATNRFIATGSTPTTYDAAGNITIDTKFRGFKYDYDANGRQSAAKLLDDTSVQGAVYDCAGQRVQTVAGGVTRTMVYDIFGQNVADYLGTTGSILERENIYRGGQLLATAETPVSAAPAGLATTTASSTSIGLSWTAAAGASNYRVERRGASGGYTLVNTTSSTSLTDSGRGTNTAYLYKVCAADGSGSCVSNYGNVALGTTVAFATDPTINTYAENPSNPTTAKAAHITELRTAVNAVRTLAGMSTGSWTNTTLTAGTSEIKADDVRDLRSELHAALATLGLYDATYTDPILATGASGTLIKKAHITELRQRSTGSSSAYKSISQFVTAFYQGVLHRDPGSGSPGELEIAVSALTAAQAQGPAALLTAAQNLGSTLFNSSEYAGLGTSNAQFVSDLYAGYLQRTPDDAGHTFWLNQLNNGDTRANQIAAFAGSIEFAANVPSLGVANSSSANIRYVLTDVQGSARAVMNNNGSSSAVVARHDYLPFGEEIGSGLGLRTTGQGYNASDTNRWKYGLTERDATTGLDHTWFRKYESTAGRWTSPDPYAGSMSIGDPQSFNRYAYVGNDPVNFGSKLNRGQAFDSAILANAK